MRLVSILGLFSFVAMAHEPFVVKPGSYIFSKGEYGNRLELHMKMAPQSVESTSKDLGYGSMVVDKNCRFQEHGASEGVPCTKVAYLPFGVKIRFLRDGHNTKG